MSKNKQDFIFLKEQNFVPSKKMGQNFLINEKIQKSIVELSDFKQNDNILEIGPGLGAISQFILDKTNNFLAVELDKRLYDYLIHHFEKSFFINDDILKIDLQSIFTLKKWNNVKVVANLPYSISSLIILKLIKISNIQEITILVQKEMAQRLLAKINTKQYNAFSILVNKFYKVKYLMNISNQNFNPKPEVESWLIKLTKYDCNEKIDIEEFNKFLKICFIAKRKKIINNLATKFNKQLIINIFNQLKINLELRPENISINQYTQLFEILYGK